MSIADTFPLDGLDGLDEELSKLADDPVISQVHTLLLLVVYVSAASAALYQPLYHD